LTKQDLFDWAAENSHKYAELNLLCEAVFDGETFINLPVQYGVYKEQYYYIDTNRAKSLREAKTINELLCGNSTVEFLRSRGNAVAVTENYEAAQSLILECVVNLKNAKKKYQVKSDY